MFNLNKGITKSYTDITKYNLTRFKHLRTIVLFNVEQLKTCKMLNNNRHYNHFKTVFQKALGLCIDIQNAEIATVFFRHAAHCNSAEISIYKPYWSSGANADIELSLYGDNDEYYKKITLESLQKLKQILEEGKGEVSERELIEQKQKEARLKQYEQLKKEFENN